MRIVPKPMRSKKFKNQWRDLQKLCANKATWPDAIKEADKLLDKALKKKLMKGKSVGERMVSAQDIMTNNDGIWFAHNLYKKLIDNPEMKLKKLDVKKALVSYGQALKDLGALK